MTKFKWVPAVEFMETAFEIQPLHMRSVLPSDFFSIKDLNAALTASATSALPFTVGGSGRTPNRSEFCTEVFNPYRHANQMEIDPAKVETFLRKGASIKIQRFATLSDKVLSILTGIESWLGFTTSANGYFSLGIEPGLPVHWDHYDLIAVQLIGKKNWKLFPPTIDHPVKANRVEVLPKPDPDSAYMEVQLKAGDALYVPRGWWHEVTPVIGEQTLHVAVGLHPPRKSDFLTWVIGEQILCDVEFRKSFLKDSNSSVDFNSMLIRLGTALRDPNVVASYWERYANLIRPIDTFKLDDQKK